MATITPTVEVIVLSAADAVAAEHGGANRLEVVQTIALGGLTPALATFKEIRAATQLPLRVMLRPNGGYAATAAEIATLCAEAQALQAAGADAFVCGFLAPDGTIDQQAMKTLLASIAPAPFTFHRAFDHTPDLPAAWATVATLGADLILTSGAPADLPVGLAALAGRAAWQTPALHWLVGGGLAIDQIPPLREAGLSQFHVGRMVRFGASWDAPIDPDGVAALRQMVVG